MKERPVRKEGFYVAIASAGIKTLGKVPTRHWGSTAREIDNYYSVAGQHVTQVAGKQAQLQGCGRSCHQSIGLCGSPPRQLPDNRRA